MEGVHLSAVAFRASRDINLKRSYSLRGEKKKKETMVVYTYHKNIPESQNVLLNITVSVWNFSSFPSASVQGQFEDLAPFFIVNYL